MASLATFAALQPPTIKGLGGSSLTGTKLSFKPTLQSLRPRRLRYYFSYTSAKLPETGSDFDVSILNLAKPFILFLLLELIRAGAVVAKYGDKSVYFDLEDLGNTTGQWDLYGSDAPSPYNSLQVCDSLLLS